MTTVAIIITFLFISPLFWVISSALSPVASIYSTKTNIIPDNITLKSLQWVFTESKFILWFKNTIILYFPTLFLTLIFTIPGAYGFSRFKFFGKNGILNSYFILSQFMSGVGIIALIPLYTLLIKLKMSNSLIVLSLIYAASLIPFVTWYLKTYIDTISKEFDEAALVEGASFTQIWWYIILPLAKPGIYTAAIISSIFVWSEWIIAGIILRGNNITIPVGLVTLAAEWFTPWNQFAAMSLVYAIPMFILFMLGRNYLRSGLTVGGLKG